MTDAEKLRYIAGIVDGRKAGGFDWAELLRGLADDLDTPGE